MPKPPVAISKKVFIELHNEGKSGLEIARFFGIGRTTVGRYYERYGLTPRSISEIRKNKFWNGGESQKEGVRKMHRERMEKKSRNYKGSFLETIGMTGAEYKAIHMWVNREKGKPSTCEGCGTTGLTGRKIGWANKSGKYKYDLKDWKRLCGPCHKAYDNNLRYN